MAYPCTCSCSCGWYPPVQVEGAPADAWWKEAIRHETENRWYVRQLPGAWAATFGGSQVGELIRHQVEPASDRSFRPFGRRVLAEPRESEEFKKVMTWVDQESEPRARPARQPSQPCQPCAPTTPTPAPVPAPAVPLSAPAPTPAAPAPAGLPSFSAYGAEPATPTAPGAPVPAQVVRPPIPEVPPGMRLEPVTFVQTAEPVSREVASAEVQPSPSLAPPAEVTDEKDSTLVPGDFQLAGRPAAASMEQATKETLDAKLGVVKAAAKLKVSSGRKETREKSKGRMQGRQKEAEDQWISRQKPKLGGWSVLRQSSMPSRGTQVRASSVQRQKEAPFETPRSASCARAAVRSQPQQFRPPPRTAAEPLTASSKGRQCSHSQVHRSSARQEGGCVVHSGAMKRSGSEPRSRGSGPARWA